MGSNLIRALKKFGSDQALALALYIETPTLGRPSSPSLGISTYNSNLKSLDLLTRVCTATLQLRLLELSLLRFGLQQ